MSFRKLWILPVAALVGLLGLVGVIGLVTEQTQESAQESAQEPSRKAAPKTPSTSAARSATPAPSPSTIDSCGYLFDAESPVDFPNPKAPAYAGPGPHLAVADTEADSPEGLEDFQLDTQSLPNDWQPWHEKRTYESDPARAELLICQTKAHKLSDKRVTRCDDDGSGWDVYPVAYTFEVYEMKTGRKVKTLNIRSDEPHTDFCPAPTQWFLGYPPDIGQHIKDETLQRRLRPLIMGPAR